MDINSIRQGQSQAIEAAPHLAQRQAERLPTLHAPLSELLQAREPEFSHPPYSSQNERELNEHDILQADWRDYAWISVVLALGGYVLFLVVTLLLGVL